MSKIHTIYVIIPVTSNSDCTSRIDLFTWRRWSEKTSKTDEIIPYTRVGELTPVDNSAYSTPYSAHSHFLNFENTTI